MIAREISFENPEDGIITLLLHTLSILYTTVMNRLSIFVELSRQDIANLTDLHVETVIRSVKKIRANNRLIIKKSQNLSLVNLYY